MKINIKQRLSRLDQEAVDSAEHLILLLSDPWDFTAKNALPYADIIARYIDRTAKRDWSEPLTIDLPNAALTKLTVACVRPDISTFDLLTLARKLAGPHASQRACKITASVLGLEKDTATRCIEAIIAATLAAGFAMPNFKTKKEESKALTEILLYFPDAKLSFKRAQAEAQGNNLARFLTALPPNELDPGAYRKRVEHLAQQHGWDAEFFDIKALQRKKAGAFLAVAQGSPNAAAGILRLRYRPVKAKKSKALALVGKGICFDTGGMNLKPARHMHGMHEDMAGSAVALGTLLALTRLKVTFPIDCWLALAENHIGPLAYKQNDVVTAANGTTIEVVHTDAEGRMVLADTLVLANQADPALIIDYATLTGSCITALGTRYSGAFTNRTEWLQTIVDAGRESGERVWPFPVDNDYDTNLQSDIADIKQCTLESEADHILGARFLNRFIQDQTPWIHIDLASANHKGGLAHIPTDVTGFGVRFTLSLVLDKNVAKLG